MTREDEIQARWKAIVKQPWIHVTEESWGYGIQSWIEPISSRPFGHIYASEETLKVHATIARAPEDIAYLSSRIDFYKDQAKADRVQIEALQEENRQLREELKVFADPHSWHTNDGENYTWNRFTNPQYEAEQALQLKEETK